MKEFIARLVFRIDINEKPDLLQLEEKTFIVRTDSSASAFTLAMELGNENQATFINKDGYHIGWRFEGVSVFAEVDPTLPSFEFCSVIKEEFTQNQFLRLKENIVAIHSQFETECIE